MPIIVNSQPQLGKTTEYRLSIQADLNGFSFSIQSSAKELLFLFQSDFKPVYGDLDLFNQQCKELFETIPLLRSKFKSVDLVVNNHKFVAIPSDLYDRDSAFFEFSKIHKLDDLEYINTIDVPKYNMKLVYCADSTLVNIISQYHSNLNIYPASYLFISSLCYYQEHNKVLFSFDGESVSIVALDGNKLIFLNSFPAIHFNSALYFLLLSVKEIQFNPEQTTVFVNGKISDLEISDMAKYFSQIKYFRNPEIPLGAAERELRYSLMMFPFDL